MADAEQARPMRAEQCEVAVIRRAAAYFSLRESLKGWHDERNDSISILDDKSDGNTGNFICWRFGMFHHPAVAVASYSTGPPAGGTPQI